MIISIIRTGGFTGIPLKKVIDTSKLPSEQAQKIELGVMNSIRQAQDEHELWEKENESKSSPDRFTYSISVQNEEINQTITLNEENLDPQTKDIISFLENLK